VLLVVLPGDASSRAASVRQLLAAFAATGLGLGLASVASTHVGTESVPVGDRGVGAGVLTAAAQIGAATSMALLLPLAGSAAVGTGYRMGYLGCCVVAAVGAVVGLFAPGWGPARPSSRPGAGR
jgi:MFS family permease